MTPWAQHYTRRQENVKVCIYIDQRDWASLSDCMLGILTVHFAVMFIMAALNCKSIHVGTTYKIYMHIQNLVLLLVYFCCSCIQVVHVSDAPPDAWELSRGEIEIGDQVGQGDYGVVFRGRLAMTAMSPRIYAHKQEMEFERNFKSHLTVAVKMLRR